MQFLKLIDDSAVKLNPQMSAIFCPPEKVRRMRAIVELPTRLEALRFQFTHNLEFGAKIDFSQGDGYLKDGAPALYSRYYIAATPTLLHPCRCTTAATPPPATPPPLHHRRYTTAATPPLHHRRYTPAATPPPPHHCRYTTAATPLPLHHTTLSLLFPTARKKNLKLHSWVSTCLKMEGTCEDQDSLAELSKLAAEMVTTEDQFNFFFSDNPRGNQAEKCCHGMLDLLNNFEKRLECPSPAPPRARRMLASPTPAPPHLIIPAPSPPAC